MMQDFLEQWRNSWEKRAPQERRILTIVAVLIVASVIYLVGIAPATQNRTQLEKSIPEMKQKAAQMNELVVQYKGLASSVADGVAPVTRELIEPTLVRRNIKTQSLSVTGELVRVQANVANYASVMEWLLEIQKAMRLTVEDIKITALTEPGQVSVVVTLKQQRAA
ncbi:type II secretion system protein GspM [Undibacterium cyanobacteriorum]|uniref:Type II secretion system protein GspM n=1 Tax=Undibacterium cyanobacteriorum TaxID=3073561 RepID=A0ABY9RFU7_9BURK|nr:type II secretion system protein GspM [Undibacterium sp. 20NA77.5]WMW79092.1 type II secretion system protein GspM [Undibacterium sp. 20NA77.5]